MINLSPVQSKELTVNWTNNSDIPGLKTLYAQQRKDLERCRLTTLAPEQLFACHLTAYLPKSGQIVPRANLRAAKSLSGERIEVPKWIEEINSWKRFTLHWTLNQCMQEHETNQMDPNVRCFAIIEPFSELQEEALGGLLEDFVTLGRHRLSKKAVVLIPIRKKGQADVEALKKAGVKIHFYTEDSLSAAVHRWFQNQSVSLLTPPYYSKRQHSFFHTLTNAPMSCVSAVQVMKSLGLHCFPHDVTPMRQIENLVSLSFTGSKEVSWLKAQVQKYSAMVEKYLLYNDKQQSDWREYIGRVHTIIDLREEFKAQPYSDETMVQLCQQRLVGAHQRARSRSCLMLAVAATICVMGIVIPSLVLKNGTI